MPREVAKSRTHATRDISQPSRGSRPASCGFKDARVEGELSLVPTRPAGSREVRVPGLDTQQSQVVDLAGGLRPTARAPRGYRPASLGPQRRAGGDRSRVAVSDSPGHRPQGKGFEPARGNPFRQCTEFPYPLPVVPITAYKTEKALTDVHQALLRNLPRQRTPRPRLPARQGVPHAPRPPEGAGSLRPHARG